MATSFGLMTQRFLAASYISPRKTFAWRNTTFCDVKHVMRNDSASPATPELKKGSLELLVLSVLAYRPRHGYEIGRLIELGSGGHLTFRITTLYPVLYRLENRGLIAGRWVERAGERRRCYYHLTEAGKTALVEQREQWEAFAAAVGRVVEGASHA